MVESSDDSSWSFFFLHIFQLFLDDTKVKNFITCFKGTCTSQFISIKLVHIADVTYPQLTTSAKHQKCISIFPFNLFSMQLFFVKSTMVRT